MRKNSPSSSWSVSAGDVAEGGDHDDAVRARHVLQDRPGDAGAVRAHDRVHPVGGDQPLGGGGGGGRVHAGGVAAHGRRLAAVHEVPAVARLLQRELGARRHRRGQRLDRAGEAEDDADLDVLGVGRRAGDQRRRDGGTRQEILSHRLVFLLAAMCLAAGLGWHDSAGSLGTRRVGRESGGGDRRPAALANRTCVTIGGGARARGARRRTPFTVPRARASIHSRSATGCRSP